MSTRTLALGEVYLPHPDAALICVRTKCPELGGGYEVVLRDRFGVGHEAVVTGRGPTPESASRSCADRLLAAISAREARTAELAARRSAAQADRALRPDPTPRAGPRPSPAGRLNRRTGSINSGRATAATGNAGYTGSVPRNADLWEVNTTGIRVRLKDGLCWSDSGTREERVFATVRLAKTATRGAIHPSDVK